VPPSFLQCLQYLQFLQALQGFAPLQVATLASGDPKVVDLIGAALRDTKAMKIMESSLYISKFLFKDMQESFKKIKVVIKFQKQILSTELHLK